MTTTIILLYHNYARCDALSACTVRTIGPDEALRLKTLEVQIPPPRPNISEGALIKSGSDLQVLP
jgi:hypothetical protein